MTDSPAAWHPDPTGRHELRYWDGTAWSDHVSDRGITGTDALGGAPPATSDSPSAPGFGTPPIGSPTGWGASPPSASSGTQPAVGSDPIGAPSPAGAPAPPPVAGFHVAVPFGPPANQPFAFVAAGAAVVLFISVFLPWRSFEIFSSGFTQSGTDMDLGTLNIVIAAVVAGLAIWQIVANANLAAKILIIVAGVGALLFDGVFVLAKKTSDRGSSIQIPYDPKIGAYLAVVAAIVIILAGAFMKTKQPTR